MKTIITQAIIICTLAAVLVGCRSTYQVRKVEPSGFLQNAEQLKKGEKDQPKLFYIDESADFKKYKKIMMDPIAAYGSTEKGSIKDLDKEDQQKLLNYFDAALRKELAKNFKLVTTPGPDVLKLRVAVTDARGSHVVLDTVSSVVPIGLALSAVKAIATGKHLSVGEIGAEIEALDSQSGKRLIAGVDARVGRKYTFKFDKFSKWHTADDAFDYWAECISHRLRAQSK